MMGCTPIEEFTPGAATPAPPLSHPLVERDLAEIQASGIIRLITRFNSNSYFVHKGGHAGFEYELFSRFAREQNLTLQVVVPDPEEDLVSLLNSGRGDVLGTGSPWDAELGKYISSTHPYNFIRKVLILKADDPRPDDMRALEGLVIHLPANSPHRPILQEIKELYRLRFFVVAAGPLVETEELIARVARGEIPATVADENLALAALSYLSGARVSASLSRELPVTWQVRKNCPELLAALNQYLNQHFQMTAEGPRRNRTYGILYERYYRSDWSSQDKPISKGRPDISGRISQWDELIRETANDVGLDWRLVTALIYQESRFDPEAVSSAGATGLMQVLPRVAGKDTERLKDPVVNIRAGAELLRDLYNGYAYMDSLDRWEFTLATYHAGYGHMTDARRIAMDYGMDPNRWRGSVQDMMPRLMKQRYFSRTRHGFYRGTETVAYVQSILNRFNMYRRLVPGIVASDSVWQEPVEEPPQPE
jgi:membrane-bound lytic murein transglycosylase F